MELLNLTPFLLFVLYDTFLILSKLTEGGLVRVIRARRRQQLHGMVHGDTPLGVRMALILSVIAMPLFLHWLNFTSPADPVQTSFWMLVNLVLLISYFVLTAILSNLLKSSNQRIWHK